MNITIRLLFAIAGVIAGIFVLIKSASNPALVATGVGLISVAVGLVVP